MSMISPAQSHTIVIAHISKKLRLIYCDEFWH